MPGGPHPWAWLRQHRHIEVVWRPLDGCLGATDGVSTIWLDPSQLQVERRCTLVHELVHLHRGHTAEVSEAEERRVAHTAARWLLPSIEGVADALAWSGGHLGEAADDLWVDEPTLRARLDGMSRRERAWLAKHGRRRGHRLP